jgi:hypothetical protein
MKKARFGIGSRKTLAPCQRRNGLSGSVRTCSGVQGLIPGTHRDYCAVVGRFLDGFCGGAAQDCHHFGARIGAVSFVGKKAWRLTCHARGTPAAALRAMLHYLKLFGLVRTVWRPRPEDPRRSSRELQVVLNSGNQAVPNPGNRRVCLHAGQSDADAAEGRRRFRAKRLSNS